MVNFNTVIVVIMQIMISGLLLFEIVYGEKTTIADIKLKVVGAEEIDKDGEKLIIISNTTTRCTSYECMNVIMRRISDKETTYGCATMITNKYERVDNNMNIIIYSVVIVLFIVQIIGIIRRVKICEYVMLVAVLILCMIVEVKIIIDIYSERGRNIYYKHKINIIAVNTINIIMNGIIIAHEIYSNKYGDRLSYNDYINLK